ncbi:hypothetical protein JW766_01970 [Candidatus Dojkabacteria bacterium]|nr:hypothetical protein [Candidatus Dojkabacteria bacterium]
MKIILLADKNSLRKIPSSNQMFLEGCIKMFSDYNRRKEVEIQCPENIKKKIKKLFPKFPVFTEPIQKGTAPAIGLAMTRVYLSNPNETVVIVYTDHPVSYKSKLLTAFKTGETFCKGLKRSILLGVNPTFPATKYGYLKIGKVLQTMNGSIVFEMIDFCEKPSKQKAEEFLKSWRYLWNTGYLIAKPKDILKIYQVALPKIYKGLMTIRESTGTNIEKKIAYTVFKNFTSTSIDKGIYEKMKKNKVGIIPIDLGIRDFEDF